jgi:hypothetical protein
MRGYVLTPARAPAVASVRLVLPIRNRSGEGDGSPYLLLAGIVEAVVSTARILTGERTRLGCW